MTAEVEAAQPTPEERLTGLERALTALLRELEDGWRCAGCRDAEERASEPEEPEEPRTTSGRDALAYMDERYPAAPAAGQHTENEEHA